MRRHRPAVGAGAFDRAAPALGVAVAGGEGGDDVPVQRDGLRVVAAVVLVLVFFRVFFVSKQSIRMEK